MFHYEYYNIFVQSFLYILLVLYIFYICCWKYNWFISKKIVYKCHHILPRTGKCVYITMYDISTTRFRCSKFHHSETIHWICTCLHLFYFSQGYITSIHKCMSWKCIGWRNKFGKKMLNDGSNDEITYYAYCKSQYWLSIMKKLIK